jgi:hypothetical protein
MLFSNITEGSFDVTTSKAGTATETFFDNLYSYPPKFTIKWDALDELNEDLLLEQNYGVLEHSIPGMDFIQDWFFPNKPSSAVGNEYTRADIIKGYLDNRYSSKFYKSKTKEIQTKLASIPVFVIVNGYNEIIVTQPSHNLGRKTSTALFKKLLAQSSDASDLYAEKGKQLGFFFLSPKDAKFYQNEIVKADSSGSNLLGLSIHCIGLDVAYRITREYHPGIDFRFIPNFQEIQTLLTKRLNTNNLIFEEGQQQMRFRPRSVNIIPSVGKIGHFLSPNTSFLQKDEYFKGVPIYIVQVAKQQKFMILSRYYNIMGQLDSFYGGFVRYFDKCIGFGHNWLMQGSITEGGTSSNYTNYVFFDQTQAEKFIKSKGSFIGRFSGSRISNVERFVRRPKIYAYNLEDFLELWEDKIANQPKKYKSVIDCKETFFVSPEEIFNEVQEVKINNQEQNIQKKVQQTLNIKYRKFKCFLDIFFTLPT